MTTPPRVQRHRQAEANRRRVTTRGKRVRRPAQPPRQTRALPRPSRRMATRTVGAVALIASIFSFAGSVITVAGAVTTAVGGVTVAWIEYRRDLIEVKRTGKPIQPDTPVKPAKTEKPKPAKPKTTPVAPVDGAKVAEMLHGGKWVNCRCGKTVPITDGSPADHDCQPPPRKPRTTQSRSKTWPPAGHNPKCRAKSAETCKCPKGRPGAKNAGRKVS
jgi:hypothetical protein